MEKHLDRELEALLAHSTESTHVRAGVGMHDLSLGAHPSTPHEASPAPCSHGPQISPPPGSTEGLEDRDSNQRATVEPWATEHTLALLTGSVLEPRQGSGIPVVAQSQCSLHASADMLHSPALSQVVCFPRGRRRRGVRVCVQETKQPKGEAG